MTDGVEVRRATLEDAPAIAEVMVASWHARVLDEQPAPIVRYRLDTHIDA